MLPPRTRLSDAACAVLAAASVVLVVLVSGTGTAHTASRPRPPDLYVELPSRPYLEHKAPVYVDAFEQRGRLLYRFDSVIRNDGGALDLYRDPASGHPMQAIWPGGRPPAQPDPNTTPSGSGVRIEDRYPSGARVSFVVERTHRHYHLFTAASYVLEVPGDERRSPKVGFCMQDTYADERYFREGYLGRGPASWCATDRPQDQFVRMGVSGGAGDLYAAQTELQWVDVTAVTPGRYRLRATANPSGHVREVTRRNNTTRSLRTIPGVRVFGGVASTGTAAPVTFGLPGEIVGPGIPARASSECEPRETGFDCYRTASARGPLAFAVVKPPAHGSVTIAASGLTGNATYTPDATFGGVDSFSYAATDARGLRSAPATVAVRVGGPDGAIRSFFVDTSRGRATARLGLRVAATVSGRLTGPHTKRTLRSRRMRAGTASIELGILPRGRYRLRVSARTPTRRFPVTQTFRVP